jgi:hypothetical protein
MEIVETGFPMERIAMDILCELPVTSGGNNLTITSSTKSFATVFASMFGIAKHSVHLV